MPQLLTSQGASRRRPWAGLAWIAGVYAALVVAISSASAAATPPDIRPVNIASVPLYAATQGELPALALALSVEFPTVGAQYVAAANSSTDATYSASTEYLGYYNSEMCYTYVNAPTETPAAGKTKSDYKRFKISGPAAQRKCNDAFSGNYLNWASNSAIDMLRLALSGGDRYIDDVGLTVLQRAVLPNGDPTCMWNSTNFPGKQLLAGDDGKYSGAVPDMMINAANAAKATSIWAANTLNRIYFGTAKTGSCNDTSKYDLAAPVGGAAVGPVTAGDTLPAGAKQCGNEGGSCLVEGLMEVWYGANGKWSRAPVYTSVACTNSVFGDPISGTAKNCYAVPYTGSWMPPGYKPGLNSEGYFYARAEVCAIDTSGVLSDTRDYGFCTRYPNNTYKPTGTIQKYNTQLRLAAFGYALEQTLSWDGSNAGRYGGVLRAPMKFVGQRTFDIHGVENTPVAGNPAAEWDAATGILAQNPDADDTFKASGVINYLNKFGRTGPVPGRYKKYDPASELYYESLRYLQGLPPSPAAVASLDKSDSTQVTYYDGFPIYKDWSSLDPYGGDRTNKADYACVKSNIALIGDINTWDSRYGTGSNGKSRMATTDVANNVPDIEGWISVVKAFETKQTSKTYVDGSGTTRAVKNPNPANGSVTERGAQLYGLAYWAHTHDVRGSGWTAKPDAQRPGLRVKTFLFDVNENATESVDNHRRYNNQYFTAAKYGGFSTQPSQDATRPYNSRGNPFYDQADVASNDVWQDPAHPGEAATYFLQSNARGVLAAFEKIFSDAASQQRSIAGAAAAGSNLTSAGSYVYQAMFDTSSWWGDVQAVKLTPGATAGDVQLATTPTWSADQKLSTRIAAGSSARNIVIGSRTPNASPAGMAFTVGMIEQALQDDLNKFGPSATADNLWKDRLAYIRGDKSKEGGVFRRRYHALGDIVNSGVQYVGAPSPTSSLGPGFQAFAQANASRGSTLYVGANDGMMHAFNAGSGEELFAYIPSWVGPQLSALTDPNYIHQAFVDATPVVGDAKTGSGNTADDWKTVLISGSGGGGKGIFALDVTDPTQFGADKVLWEFTQANDADMGYVLGKVRIAKFRTSAPGSGSPTYRWFAVVPAGVNNYVSSAGVFSSTGNPTIFLLALDKPAGQAWVGPGTGATPNYYKLSLPFDATIKDSTGSTTQTAPTGVINLEAFMDGSGVVTHLYAGDLHGKVWAFDFSLVGQDNWYSGGLSRAFTGTNPTKTAIPLYIAKDPSGKTQPITAAPTILQASTDATAHFIGFGTGKYIEASDSTSTQVNTYYTLYDFNNSAGGSTVSPDVSGSVVIASRARLQKVSYTASSGALSPDNAFTWGHATSDSDTAHRSGWYYDLPATGERVVYDSVYVPLTTKVGFSSLIPDSASSPGVCTVSGGSGNNYYVDLMAATGLLRASTVGVSGQPIIAFNDVTTTVTAADSTGRRLRTRPVVLIQQGSSGVNAQQITQETYSFGRLSWRQINNYLERKK